jgi:hypothetical protein
MPDTGIWIPSRAIDDSAFRQIGNLPNREAKFATEYRLDSSKVDVKLARALYNNTEPRYKLGAGFSRPAINVPVGFMGVPFFRETNRTENSKAQEILDRLQRSWMGSVIKAHTAVLRDGEALLRLRPGNRSPAYASLFAGQSASEKDLELVYEPVEAYEILYMDEDRGSIEGIKVKHVFTTEEPGGQTVERHLYEIVTADKVRLEYENKWKPDRTFPNTLGFVPAIHIQNETERHKLKGRSELEPLEPYMRFYNDVMLHAGSASALHSTAKLSLRVQDVEDFLTNNFSDTEIAEGKLKFKDKDVLFFESGAPELGVTGSTAYTEGAEIIQAKAPLGDTNTLLEYIFLNIVDVSEVPEWAFGGAIASSKASVTEQSAPLIHKVSRKRFLFEPTWAMAGRMGLHMLGQENVDVNVEWDTLSTKDTKAENEAIKFLAEALVVLNDAEIMSKQSIVETLKPYLAKLQSYSFDDSSDERTRIEAEVAEKIEKLNRDFDEEEEALEDEDRQAGLRAIG